MVAPKPAIPLLARRVVVCVAMVLVAASCTEGDAVAGPTVSELDPGPSTVAPGSSAMGGAVQEDPNGPEATTPDGEPIGPVATRQVSGGSTSIYSGVLGRLDPTEQVVPPLGQPPVNSEQVLPLTGLVGSVPDRPAAVVKIDNVAPASPQTGLGNADIVYEEEVEAGFTRLAAVFHSQSSYVGPVRSGRTTDIGVLSLFTSPIFVYSGANVATDSLIRSQAYVQNHSFDTTSGFWRQPGRPSPSDLYTHLSPHWETATGAAPRQQFHYRSDDEPVPGSDVTSFRVSYRQNRVDWGWNGTAWQRQQGGTPHVDVDSAQLEAANVVVVETRRVDTGMVDATGQQVPEFVFVGSGPASVFTGGKRIDGTWTRSRLADVPTFTTGSGETIELGVGTTWVEIVSSIDQLQ